MLQTDERLKKKILIISKKFKDRRVGEYNFLMEERENNIQQMRKITIQHRIQSKKLKDNIECINHKKEYIIQHLQEQIKELMEFNERIEQEREKEIWENVELNSEKLIIGKNCILDS